ncbi:hypothetical protein X801_00406 [Opisthorchis viverrini]|uniref:EF-hand domain-containing protein n=1 Tax=Opisthorchis viverrini TaxID=6198 RepID=A0A1S8XAE4_OPIVI|nr:hypothetical protein X801_00406 [Opisthorchis viverrini]
MISKVYSWCTNLKDLSQVTRVIIFSSTDPHILEERQKPRDRWLQRLFSEADTCSSGYLEEGTAMRLIMSINPELSETHIRHQWKDSDFRSREQKGRLDVADFTKFYKKLVHRQEIYYILVRIVYDAVKTLCCRKAKKLVEQKNNYRLKRKNT